jgi:predicted nucleic acid-binding protein
VNYLFDTDVLSNTLKKRPSPGLLARLAGIPVEAQFTSAITVGEMLYGALRSDRKADLLARLATEVWPRLQVLSFDSTAAAEYARIRFDLEVSGTPLAEPDLRIAAIAVSRRMTLVTGNVRHFERVPGLAVENWLAG